MAMKPVEQFPVDITFAFQQRKVQSIIFTPASWRAAAQSLGETRERTIGHQRCLVSWPDEAAPNSPEEHVVPKATGIKWISLPHGLISGAFNNRASAWELEFLRKGLMGALRPFYVFGKKEVEFPFHDGKRIVFRNEPKGNFKIETWGFPPLPEPPPNSHGTIGFPLPLEQPPTRIASCALTKIAYLVLAVVRPEIAFSDALSDVRGYLANDLAPYRPYGEIFLPGRRPGAGVSYLVTGQYIGGGNCEIATISVKILLHHVQYALRLAGPALGAPPEENEMTWYLSDLPTRTHPSKLCWNFQRGCPGEREAAQQAVAALVRSSREKSGD